MSVNDLPAFPPARFTKEKAEKLQKMIEEAKKKHEKDKTSLEQD